MGKRFFSCILFLIMLLISFSIQAKIPNSGVTAWSNAKDVLEILTGRREINYTNFEVTAERTLKRPFPVTRFKSGSNEPVNQPPVINLKSTEIISLPAASFTIRGSATDSDGTIASYSWTKVSGADITMEGSSTAILVLKDLTEGTYKFKLTVADNNGSAESKEITLTINPGANELPVVSITCPANNATSKTGNPVVITVDATDEDSSVSKVEFYVAGEKIGEDILAPYAFSWTPEKAGTYVLTVKATDNSGGTAISSSITLEVEDKENIAPVVGLEEEKEITLPENETTLNSTAIDTDGTISSQEWTKISGPSVEMSGRETISLALSQLLEGIYIFRFTATDNRGAAVSKDIKLIVLPAPNQMPEVRLTSPALNTSYSLGESVEIMAEASDPEGKISLVEFFQGKEKLGEDISAPYSYTWTPSVTGGFTLLAKVTDDKGAIAFSNTGFVQVKGVPEISLKEKETITLPVAGLTITATATATDADGTIASYEWTKTKGGTAVMSGIHTSSLKLEKLAAGIYEFTLTVTDNDGATASKKVIVEVLPDPNILPIVSITSPTANAVYDQGSVVEISAVASDAGGTISSVVFYAGFNKIGEIKAAPYTLSWTPETTGTYSVTAKAFDNAGASVLSEAVNIIVNKKDEGPDEPETPERAVTEYEGEGTILREFYDNIKGTAITDIPTEGAPSASGLLQSLEGPVNVGENYGSRIRGYVHPPVSGTYTFWISGNDVAELYLSTDESPENKQLIAKAAGNKIMRQWNKEQAQQSRAISLEGGKKYYIEVLHKGANGGDHVAVGWQMANGIYERPVPGNRLSPYVPQNVLAVRTDHTAEGGMKLYPNPVDEVLYLETEHNIGMEGKWTILDMQGKIYTRQAGNLQLKPTKVQALDLSSLNLPAGIYLLKIQMKHKIQILKFIKR